MGKIFIFLYDDTDRKSDHIGSSGLPAPSPFAQRPHWPRWGKEVLPQARPQDQRQASGRRRSRGRRYEAIDHLLKDTQAEPR